MSLTTVPEAFPGIMHIVRLSSDATTRVGLAQSALAFPPFAPVPALLGPLVPPVEAQVVDELIEPVPFWQIAVPV
ncbi:hypothetical protein WL358_12865, partial [Staphylococcus epidermidis]